MHRSSFESSFTHDKVGLMDRAVASGEIHHGSWMVLYLSGYCNDLGKIEE